MQHARHVHVGRELYGLCAHDVKHTCCVLLLQQGASVGAVLLSSFDDHLSERLRVFFERYVEAFAVFHVNRHLHGLVGHILDDEGESSLVGHLVERERSVQARRCPHVFQLLHRHDCADERFAGGLVFHHADDVASRRGRCCHSCDESHRQGFNIHCAVFFFLFSFFA